MENLKKTKSKYNPSVRFTQVTEKQKKSESPTFKKYKQFAKPGPALQASIAEQKRDLQMLIREVESGCKRDSINDEDYKTIIELKKKEIELNEYIQQDALRKDVIDIVNIQKQGQRMVREIFSSAEAKKPGVSPVKHLIKGQNPRLYYQEYNKNYGYKSQLEEPKKKTPKISEMNRGKSQ